LVPGDEELARDQVGVKALRERAAQKKATLTGLTDYPTNRLNEYT